MQKSFEEHYIGKSLINGRQILCIIHVLALSIKPILVTEYYKLFLSSAGFMTTINLHATLFSFVHIRFSQTVSSVAFLFFSFFPTKLSGVFETKNFTSTLYVLREEKVSHLLNYQTYTASSKTVMAWKMDYLATDLYPFFINF